MISYHMISYHVLKICWKGNGHKHGPENKLEIIRRFPIQLFFADMFKVHYINYILECHVSKSKIIEIRILSKLVSLVDAAASAAADISYHIISYDIISHDIVSYEMIPYDIIWYDILSYDKIWYHILRYGIISYNMKWYHSISYHIRR